MIMKAEVISFNEGTLEARPYKDSVMSTRAPMFSTNFT